MEAKVKLRKIKIVDEDTNDEHTVLTCRSAQDIASALDEQEKDAIVDELHTAVIDAHEKYLEGLK